MPWGITPSVINEKGCRDRARSSERTEPAAAVPPKIEKTSAGERVSIILPTAPLMSQRREFRLDEEILLMIVIFAAYTKKRVRKLRRCHDAIFVDNGICNRICGSHASSSGG
jgi:hypothetical protein